MYNQDQNRTFCIEIFPLSMHFENMLSNDNFYYSLLQSIVFLVFPNKNAFNTYYYTL